jgi:hypothetical protein
MKLSHAASTTLTAIAELQWPLGVGSGDLLGQKLARFVKETLPPRFTKRPQFWWIHEPEKPEDETLGDILAVESPNRQLLKYSGIGKAALEIINRRLKSEGIYLA